MNRRSSIRGELITLCVGILAISLLIQILCNGFLARRFTIYEKERQMESLFLELTQNYNPDPDYLFELTRDKQNVDNIRVFIQSQEGNTVYSSGGEPYDLVPNAGVRNGSLTSQGGSQGGRAPYPFDPAVDVPPQAEVGREIILIEEIIEYEGELHTITLLSSIIAIDSSVALFTKINLAVSSVVMLLGVLLVVWVSRRFTRPLEDIQSVAVHLARSDFQVMARENIGPKELQSLAVSVNTMARQLESMIGQLSADNQSLSEKVEYQEKLEQMRRQFVANISHEMKTPLSMLMMYSESLKSNVAGIDKEYYCSVIMEEAAGLDAMVAQLLDISSIENGLLQMDLQDVDMSHFVEELCGKMSVLFEGKNLVAEVVPSVMVRGDLKYLEQAVRNILSNASSHAPLGSQVTATLKTSGETVVFSVHNQGPQIPEEDFLHIWESFYRGDKSRTQGSQKRVGLGLYIVKTCVEAHGGQVEVENVEDGVVFSIHLPKA